MAKNVALPADDSKAIDFLDEKSFKSVLKNSQYDSVFTKVRQEAYSRLALLPNPLLPNELWRHTKADKFDLLRLGSSVPVSIELLHSSGAAVSSDYVEVLRSSDGSSIPESIAEEIFHAKSDNLEKDAVSWLQLATCASSTFIRV